MAARLDALAREFFTPSSLLSAHEPCRRDGASGNSSGPRGASRGGVRGIAESATALPSAWEEEGVGGHEACGGQYNSRNKRRMGQFVAHDDAHFFPPLLQYFGELAMASTAASSATHTFLGAPSGVSSSSAIPRMRTASLGYASMWRHTRRIVREGGMILRAHRSVTHERHQADNYTTGNAAKASGSALLLGSHRSAPFSHTGAYSDRHHSSEMIDVFANYQQLPLTDGGASYEALEPNYQRGLNALATLIEQYNRSFVQERGSAATACTLLGKRALNSESVSATASSVTTGPSDQRDAIVNRLNILLRDLVSHGERALVLHIIMRAIGWRFASKNERVTILFNHLRTCLPLASVSIVTLAMEVWGQLHVIEASSSVYLKVTSELLSLACDFLHYDDTLAAKLSGLIIIRHVALWPMSLYRALLSNEQDSLLLATWTAIPNDESPYFIRELAAETLRALFVIALKQRNYRSVNTVLQQALALLHISERGVELPSSFSLSSLSPYQIGGEGLHEFHPPPGWASTTVCAVLGVTDAAGWGPPKR
ncbi:hypothetical protein TraAM80_02785 [Trypanosoma rangeli]|uniref:Uncharacterized protein n=1 Tax=Trypanosoma rangeli TaxID=5698 RepID=A0A3R7KRJ0_TRYRA|nr:uncharacterized protein TraAM80_02785 [Trypanosoma rangeli]RNF08279.1 hypothetical protein TraAM80_02785 [Trypanosoma rangeli]|eukprot:RNF08279.1 hypothetical protein TraAM80_02785 [Trypanosoma rangeli]